MSWETERSRAGKKPWNWVEIELDRCANTYGDAFESPTGLCTAVVGVDGAQKCFNSWETCQDQDNYVKAPFWVRFAEPVSNLPRNALFNEDGLATFLPFLDKISHSPSLPDPGESMGLRVQLTVSLMDGPHHDRGVDKYVDERTYDPMRQGTFLRKMKARWPHYIGRRLRWYQGYIPENASYVFVQQGGANNYAHTPNSEAINIPGDIDIRFEIAPDSSTPSSSRNIFRKDNQTDQRSYRAFLRSTGLIEFAISTDGTGPSLVQYFSTVAPFTDKTPRAIKITLDVDDGDSPGISTCTFYVSDDHGETWQQLGDPVTAAAVTIHEGTSELRIGSGETFDGAIYWLEVREGIDGTLVASFDPNESGGALSWRSSETGELWSLQQSGTSPGYLAVDPYPEMRLREYVMERFEGPDARGRVRIIAKDPLKLVDNDRAQAPRPSKGKLVADMADTDTPAAFDVQTTDLTEYDLTGSPSVGYVRIGGEVFTYTGTALSSPDEGNVTLTGVTRSAPSPYMSPVEDHDAGDLVQRCHYFQGTIPAVINELLATFGGLSASYITLADWTSESTTWLSGETISRLVTDPEGVQDLVNEIIRQTLTWGVWFDEVAQQIRFRAIRPADITDTVASITDSANIVADSIKIVDDPGAVINEVQALYGQIDPTKSADDLENYRAGIAVVDTDSQSVNELGQRRIKRVFARWRHVVDESSVLAWAQRTLSSKAKNLQTIEFHIDRKDENINTADFADLETLYVIDETGMPRVFRVQVLRADSTGERVMLRAREDFFRISAFGRWAPEESPDVEFENASDAQKLQYIFWADDDGNNGTSFSPQAPVEGKRWQ